jgi:hypothetical protein
MIQAFRPTPAATVNIDVASTTGRVLITADSCNAIRVMNNGTATAWIGFGDITATAAIATGMPVGPGVTEILRFTNKSGAALYATAIAAASTGKIYFTPGTGN